jgi:hypothetical protein
VTTRSLKIALMHLAPEIGALDANRALIVSGELDSGLPLVVCNRSGRDDESHIKLISLRSSDSTVFVVDCLIRDGRIVRCELIASARGQA